MAYQARFNAGASRPDQQALPRLSFQGDQALLLDASGPEGFDVRTQQRVLALAQKLRSSSAPEGVGEAVPGMNNLMVTFDPRVLPPEAAKARVLEFWQAAGAVNMVGREVELPVTYGGKRGEDLREAAEQLGLSLHELIELHSGGEYTVACIGSMPGFAYLAGLNARLCLPRRAVPRREVAQGAVIMAAGQAGVMPCTAPSGWHILGHTEVRLFDLDRENPSLLRPGDRVRFTVAEVSA